MTASQLSIYNNALIALEETTLDSIDEDTPNRYILDTIWDDGLVDGCLESGLWAFSLRTIEINYDTDIEPDFGYQYAFTKPDDYIRLSRISIDDYFRNPLRRYQDNVDNWFTDVTIIYVEYVSNDSAYGLNYARWPESFNNFVQLMLAYKACIRITGNYQKKQVLEADMRKALLEARSRGAMNKEVGMFPIGTWAGARMRRPGSSWLKTLNGAIDY